MMIRRHGFNLFFFVTLAVLCGCQSPEEKKKKEFSTLRVHIETLADAADRSIKVPVFRAQPVTITIDKNPFLTEGDVSEATVIDDMGGFALRIKFGQQGTWLLEQFTAANRGKHLAVFSQFQADLAPKPPSSRWLAAPKISKKVSDGVLTFVPDATLEEAKQIALGLNNVARKYEHYKQ
jgi:preprotein translocase subunit SecD